MISEKRSSMLHGVLLITLFSCAAFYIGEMNFVKELSFSPMIVGIILGMLYANSLRNNLPETWVPGIQFCSKRILRIGIILYGFRLTFQDVLAVGLPAIFIDTIIVTTTILGGILIGRMLKMERGIALLTSIGSGICGAAAILGAESTIQTKPYKTAVAVSTVVIFGTISMFIYPILYHNGTFVLSANEMGIFTGATLHEVAHTVGAGNAMGKEISDVAIIVKMIGSMKKVSIPWFAIGFLAVIGFNSFDLLPQSLTAFINNVDTFLLTMAMTALGAETSIDKFRKAGAKPFVLASILYIWLIAGGYFLVKYMAPIFM